MRTSKLKILNLVAVNKEIVRTVTATSAAVKTDNIKPWTEIPGPSSLPIIGQLHHFLLGELSKIEQNKVTMKLFETHGPIVRFDEMLGKPAMILLYEPECCSKVLRSENWTPMRSGFQSLEYYRKVLKKQRGHKSRVSGLISDHGEVWKEFRSTVNPVMLQPKTIKLYCSVLDEVAQDMILRMKSLRDENNMIKENFDTEMNLWALESIGTVALGCRLNCFRKDLPDDSPEKQLIQCIHDLFIIANEIDFKPNLWRYFSTPLFKKAMRLYEHHETLTKYFLQKGIDQLKTKSDNDNEKGVLEKLLEIDEEVAYIMASDMLFAGVDTAANTITATLYLLATNPDKQDKLRAEIMSKSEKRPYLKACIKESLRVMPVVSGNMRQTTKDIDVMGYRIPKDMHVVFANQDMSSMEQHFPRAKEYIPERWVTDKSDPMYYGNTHPFVYMPFGFGTRSCIGRRIAELEVDTFVARLIENFKVEWVGSAPTVSQTSLNYVKGPFNFIFKDV
ncbi:cytochrome P450 CYP12A2-like [Trichoplusia ni]|uniref:Cytochrome P450 CYP12A2-like n=1 Tax=Trichoplusia ni TaxID=7111 RepID=A0A7E5WYW2_TRINI|nr:cytochrome P450 CYP12A2-like [Trichoplusia ni]